VVLAVVSVITLPLVVWVWFFGGTFHPTPVSTAVARPAGEVVATEVADVTVADAMARLNDPARPWTLTVLGDSTGNGQDEWVYLTAARLSEKYQRPVTVHDWSETQNVYVSENTVGGGSNAPITIWNASASGMNADYSLQFLDVEEPAPSDLIIVNHGHNYAEPNNAVQSLSALLHKLDTQADAGLAVTLQPARLDDTADMHASIIAAYREKFAGRELIDVWSAWEATGDITPLLNENDKRHPTQEGSRVWADAVGSFLGI